MWFRKILITGLNAPIVALVPLKMTEKKILKKKKRSKHGTGGLSDGY
jgi:hypothetical protein